MLKHIIVCPTIFCSILVSVFSLVAIIYATMMIYIPADLEMKTKVKGPFKCTTTKVDFNVGNCSWWSCADWCLNKPPKLCHQVRVDVRRPGVDLQLQHCQIEERESCKNGQELQEFSFKTSDCDSKCYQKTLSNVTKNSTILMCKDGLCKEYSSEYQCDNVQTYLDVIQDGNQCDCQAYAGTYYPVVEYLHLSESECPQKTYEYFLGCHQICEYRQKCFNMTRLTKRGFIGKDYIIQDRVHKVYNMKRDIELPDHRFFQCYNEFCSEIQSMDCNPTCHYAKFSRGHGKILILYRNNVITAKCNQKSKEMQNAILHCNEYDFHNGTIDVKDCVTGKQGNEAPEALDFKSLQDYFRDHPVNLKGFSDYKDLVIHPNVKFLVNIEGCVNLENCSIDFFDEIRKNRDQYENYTVPCYYDEFTQAAIFKYQPDAQKVALYIAAFVPTSLLVISCLLMSIITALFEVDSDGNIVKKTVKIMKQKDPWNIF